jgi:hypothetical protein
MSDHDGGLDDLFSSRDEPRAEEVEAVERPRPVALRLAGNALLIAAATTVTVAGLRSAGMRTSILLIVGAFTGLRLIMLAVSEVAPPALPKRRAGSAGSSSGPQGDALRAAVRRWEQNLSRAHADSDLYSRNVLPVLAELTDERLRLRHGITRASDPRRARALLGDPLWAALHDPGRQAAKARDIETYVDALERL